jgi:anaerobic selenocysteine-containing dehydrogenase
MLDHIYHPQRLNHPLKRVGKKGEGHWERVTWDQALDEVAEKLSKLKSQYGAETLAFTHGTKRTYHWDCRRFFNIFGSPNTCGVNTICMCPSYATEYATYGGMVMPGNEILSSRCMVVWGCNASKSSPVGLYPKIVKARQNGAKLIVIDPRKTKEAESADLWLQIRPGTDLALMLGWIRHIITNDLYDREFVAKWTVGFEDLKAAVASYTPEKVSEITSVPSGLIIEAATMYSTTSPASIPFGLGLDKQGLNATQCARGRAILRAITGNLEVPGGEVLVGRQRLGKSVMPSISNATNLSLRAKEPNSWARTNTPSSVFRVGKETLPPIRNCRKAMCPRRKPGTPIWRMPERSWTPSLPASRTR